LRHGSVLARGERVRKSCFWFCFLCVVQGSGCLFVWCVAPLVGCCCEGCARCFYHGRASPKAHRGCTCRYTDDVVNSRFHRKSRRAPAGGFYGGEEEREVGAVFTGQNSFNTQGTATQAGSSATTKKHPFYLEEEQARRQLADPVRRQAARRRQRRGRDILGRACGSGCRHSGTNSGCCAAPANRARRCSARHEPKQCCTVNRFEMFVVLLIDAQSPQKTDRAAGCGRVTPHTQTQTQQHSQHSPLHRPKQRTTRN
jgi:hypothetical protein